MPDDQTFAVPTVPTKPDGSADSGFAIPALPSLKRKEFAAPAAPPPKRTAPSLPEQSQSAPVPPPLKYGAPEWSAMPADEYGFEVIKGGTIVDKVKIQKPVTVVGRLPNCDVEMEHASISRYHAVIQGKEDSVYLYDLGSAHSTHLNKKAIPPRQHIKIRVGDMIRFGQSTRSYVLYGPEAELEPATPVQVQMPQQRAVKPAEDKMEVTWGFAEDAKEDDDEDGIDLGQDLPDDESAYYYKDPRKALRVWFETKGGNMHFDFEEDGKGVNRIYVSTVVCDYETGSVTGTGKSTRKKDAERLAALDACRKLDRKKRFRPEDIKAQERAEKARLFGDDADDDGDSFYDRTAEGPPMPPEADDELDQFMRNLQNADVQKANAVLQKNVAALRKESERLMRLLKITQPTFAADNPAPVRISERASPKKLAEVLEPPAVKTKEVAPFAKPQKGVPAVSTLQPDSQSAAVSEAGNVEEAVALEKPEVLDATQAGTKRRRVFMAISKQTVARHEAFENEEVVDAVSKTDATNMASKYGY
ncbi:Kanadaptin [Irineochytrium annulatum]|nr:Kanadaptin [Irineochytrium annulatum]